MTHSLCHGSFFSCKDNTLNARIKKKHHNLSDNFSPFRFDLLVFIDIVCSFCFIRDVDAICGVDKFLIVTNIKATVSGVSMHQDLELFFKVCIPRHISMASVFSPSG